MAVAIDRQAIGLAAPGADRRLQVADIVVHLDLLGDPVRHFRCQALAADVALERGAHFDDVEVNSSGRHRLLQAGVVVGLREIDPGDLGAGVFLPRLQQAAEQHVVHILVVEAHEAQLDAGKLAFLDACLGRVEAERPDLLPVSVGRLAGAYARDLQDLRAQIVLRRSLARQRAECTGRRGRERDRAGGTLENVTAGRAGAN